MTRYLCALYVGPETWKSHKTKRTEIRVVRADNAPGAAAQAFVVDDLFASRRQNRVVAEAAVEVFKVAVRESCTGRQWVIGVELDFSEALHVRGDLPS